MSSWNLRCPRGHVFLSIVTIVIDPPIDDCFFGARRTLALLDVSLATIYC